MSNRKSKSTSTGALAGFILVGILAVGGIAAYVKYTPADRVPEESHRDSVKRPEPNVSIEKRPSTTEHEHVWVLKLSSEGAEPEFTKERAELPKGAEPHRFAVEQFLRDSGLTPSNVRLLSVSIEDGIVKLMFNAAFNDIALGSTGESAFLKGISISLSQFSDVKQMQFFADGQPVAGFGNVDLSEPLPLDTEARVTAAPSKP